jgi:iron complex outermembrane recepter protein
MLESLSAHRRRAASCVPRALRSGAGARWLLSALAVVSLWSGPVRAVEPPAARTVFDLPPQALEDALIQFSEQSGRQFVAIGDLRAAPRTPRVQGAMDDRDALRRLLAGSGFDFRVSEDGVVTIAPATAAPPRRRVSRPRRRAARRSTWARCR